MQIPEEFKKAIEEIFYDKDLEIWTSDIIKDNEGSFIGQGKKENIDKFKGNFQFQTREQIQKEYGQEIEANAVVTCNNTIAEIGNILIYDNKDYVIIAKLKSDSHITLLVKGDEQNV